LRITKNTKKYLAIVHTEDASRKVQPTLQKIR